MSQTILGITGIPEIDVAILLELPYKDILQACQINMSVNQICQDDYFWRQILRRDFGEEGARNKPQDETFRQQYEYLRMVEDVFNEATRGRVDGLIALENKGTFSSVNEYIGEPPYVDAANSAAINGNLNVLEWLALRRIFPNDPGADAVAGVGRIDVLEWLEAHDVYTDDRSANEAAANGHTRVLDWLERRGIRPNVRGANSAAGAGHIETLQWLESRNILPDINGANAAAGAGHLNVLEWLEQRGILPTAEGFRRAIASYRVDVLNWLSSRRIF